MLLQGAHKLNQYFQFHLEAVHHDTATESKKAAALKIRNPFPVKRAVQTSDSHVDSQGPCQQRAGQGWAEEHAKPLSSLSLCNCSYLLAARRMERVRRGSKRVKKII